MYYTAAKYDPHGVSYVNYTNFTEVHCDRCKQWIPGKLSGLGMRLCKLLMKQEIRETCYMVHQCVIWKTNIILLHHTAQYQFFDLGLPLMLC